ncbi:MAG: sugar-binding domain-containing protein [Bacteroidota bacterium]
MYLYLLIAPFSISISRNVKYFTFLFLYVCLFISAAHSQELENREQDFNRDWKFSLNIGKEAMQAEFYDADWRTVHLPHDWSVEFPFDSIKGEGCTAYLPGGIGWYRKHFSIDIDKNKSTFILFDGVYNNAEIWLNGTLLGEHPYGYSPFYFDLTPYLRKRGKENVLAVKVDRSRYADSRWYSGSGIYRDVKLITVPKVHIPIWGTFITTPLATQEKAEIQVQTTLVNGLSKPKSLALLTQLTAPDGTVVMENKQELRIEQKGVEKLKQVFEISNPLLWDLKQPQQYKAISQIWEGEQIIDQSITHFGIRSFKFDKDQGFFLNGKPHKIKGVCLHHDGGLVGAAVPKGVWRRRLRTLKDGGCNAIRISHNPGSEEFLELCDEMGFLVQDEFFDEWDYPKDKRFNMGERRVDYITQGYTEHFSKWAEIDLKNTVLAHRNHPSIIQWSIGNEIEWTYPKEAASTGFFDANWSGNYFWSQPPYSVEKIREMQKTLDRKAHDIGSTAKKLAAWTRELDTSRPVIANCILPSASYESGYADALDIIGYSYRRVIYDYGHKNYPDLPIMGTENLGQYHEWKAVMERPFVSGTFLWTGIDYMGEANGGWPRKGTASGLLDQAGFEKPSYYMMKSLWSNSPSINMTTQLLPQSIFEINEAGKVVEKKPGGWEKALWVWQDVNEHWNYKVGETVIVEVLSNASEVELFLNDQSLGSKFLSDFEDHIYKWAVPFAEGELMAVAHVGEEEVRTILKTAAEPSSFTLTPDKIELKTDGKDVAHLVVQLVDKNGNPVKHLEQEIQIEVLGEIKLLGVDNGAPDNVQPYQSPKILTDQGRALIIVQSLLKPGIGTVKVSGKNIRERSLSISIQ